MLLWFSFLISPPFFFSGPFFLYNLGTDRKGNTSSKNSSVVAYLFVAAEMRLFGCYLAAYDVYVIMSQYLTLQWLSLSLPTQCAMYRDSWNRWTFHGDERIHYVPSAQQMNSTVVDSYCVTGICEQSPPRGHVAVRNIQLQRLSARAEPYYSLRQ